MRMWAVVPVRKEATRRAACPQTAEDLVICLERQPRCGTILQQREGGYTHLGVRRQTTCAFWQGHSGRGDAPSTAHGNVHRKRQEHDRHVRGSAAWCTERPSNTRRAYHPRTDGGPVTIIMVSIVSVPGSIRSCSRRRPGPPSIVRGGSSTPPGRATL